MPTKAFKRLEQVVEEVGYGRFQHRLFLLCGLVFMVDGMWFTSLSYIIHRVSQSDSGHDWKLSEMSTSLVSGAQFLGLVAGAVLWGYLSDYIGRRPSLVACLVCSTVGGSVSCFAFDMYFLMFFLFIVGVGSGGCIPVAASLFSECTVKSKRFFLSLLCVLWAFGGFATSGFAWILVPHKYFSLEGWRWLQGSLGTLNLVFLVAVLVMCPESPRFLLVHGKKKEASALLQKIAVTNDVLLNPFELVDPNVWTCTYGTMTVPAASVAPINPTPTTPTTVKVLEGVTPIDPVGGDTPDLAPAVVTTPDSPGGLRRNGQSALRVVDPDPSTLYDGTGSAVSEGEDSQDSDSDLESLLGDGLHLPSHITPARGWDDRAHRTSKKKSAFAHVPKCFRIFRSPFSCHSVLLLLIWWFAFLGFCGFTIFMPEFFSDKKIATRNIYPDSFFMQSGGPLGALVSSLIIRIPFVGRKWTLILSFLLSGVATFFFLLTSSSTQLVALCSIMYFFSFSGVSAMLTLTAELYPTSIRSTALGLCVCSSKGANLVSPLLAGFLQDGVTSVAIPVTIYAGSFWLATILALFLPETRGRDTVDTQTEAQHGEEGQLLIPSQHHINMGSSAQVFLVRH